MSHIFYFFLLIFTTLSSNQINCMLASKSDTLDMLSDTNVVVGFNSLVKGSQTVPGYVIMAQEKGDGFYKQYEQNEQNFVMTKSALVQYAKSRYHYNQTLLEEVMQQSGINYQMFTEACLNRINLYKNTILKKSVWVGEPLANSDMVGFNPYIMGIRLSETAQEKKVYLFPDLHGDYKTVMKFLAPMFDDNFLIKNKSHKVFFLGDIVDRGIGGAEAFFIAMTLSYKNPDNVFVIRGNHEDSNLNCEYGFLYELLSKYKEPNHETLISLLSEVYNTLPLAAIIVNGNQGIVGCHGNLDQRYNAKALVAALWQGKGQNSEQKNDCDLVRYEKYPLSGFSVHADNTNFRNIFNKNVVEDFNREALIADPNKIMFMWLDHCDCQVDKCLNDKTYYMYWNANKRSSMQIHKCHIAALLADWSTRNVQLTDVVRAHQHVASLSGESLMKALFKGKGLYKAKCLDDKHCYTGLLQPDNEYGCPSQKYPGFNYGTVVIAQPQENGFEISKENIQSFLVDPARISFIAHEDEKISTYVDENNQFYEYSEQQLINV